MIAFIARSLRRKVMLLVLATMFAALTLSAVGLVIIDLREFERQWTSDMRTQADILARASAPAIAFNDAKSAVEDLRLLQVRPSVAAAGIYKRDGTLFATYVRGEGETEAPFPTSPELEGYRIEGDQLLLFRPIIEKDERIGTVFLRTDYRPWERLVSYLAVLGVVMAASLALVALLSGWLQRALTDPILEVAGVAREVMTQRDYTLRARKSTEDEIGQLVDSFNAMLAEAGRRAEQLREADRRKDEFLATLAHELRNPLAPLRNALEILRLAGNDPATSKKAREMMERQLAQMVRLVDDLLDVSRITTGKLAVHKSTVELQSIIHNAVETSRPFIDMQRHRLVVDAGRAPILVEADATRLAQIFSNLLHNAAKYTEPGGRIELTARREGAQAVVRVRDNGIGIAPAMLDSIFGMFVQADRTLERAQAGLGVGLTLAQRLAALHGGTIEAHSEGPGKGSEFVVRIPAAHPAGEGLREPASPDHASGTRQRVLLADDNVDFASSMALLLSSQGHDVRVAHDGAEALEVAEAFQPDIAFLDIGMPKVHGYEVARRMRKGPRTARCRLVAVTGWGQEEDKRRAREAGFDRHVVKPVDPRVIEGILAEH